MMKKAILYIALIFTTIVANAQIAVNAKLDSNNITIGDQVRLTISFPPSADGAVWVMPTPDSFEQTGVEVVDFKLDTTFSQSGDIVSFDNSYIITSFEPGIDTISNLVAHCLLPNGLAEEMVLDTLYLTVNDVDVDTSLAIKDIAGVVSVPYTFRDFLPWILVVLVVAVVVFLVIYLYKRIKNKEPIIPAPKPVVLDPEDKALQDLEHLRVAGLWKKGMVKEYHTQLTDILRSYMENKLGICAIEMTSDQILDSYSEKTNMPDGTMEKLQSILRTADMVKFAKSEPMPNEHERSMNYAISFVQETANRLKELALAASKKTDITTNNNG